jgi:hypothetical protein
MLSKKKRKKVTPLGEETDGESSIKTLPTEMSDCTPDKDTQRN